MESKHPVHGAGRGADAAFPRHAARTGSLGYARFASSARDDMLQQRHGSVVVPGQRHGFHVIPSGAPAGRGVEGSPARHMARRRPDPLPQALHDAQDVAVATPLVAYVVHRLAHDVDAIAPDATLSKIIDSFPSIIKISFIV